MAKVVKFPLPTPEKFGPVRVEKKKDVPTENKAGQLNLFTGAKIVRLHQLTEFEEALITDNQGDSNGARKLYLKAIEEGEALADAYCNLGIIEWQEGNTTKAIDSFTLSLKNEPRHFEAHYNLANLYGEIGNFPLAKVHYEVSIEVEPTFPNSYFNLALTLAMNKEFDAAVKALYQYRQLTAPENHQQADDLIRKFQEAR
ncbi:Tetratricopeptide repeat-containing protein [Chryseolinea serpens]|jgi:tetratricopeptide (TPR) repeat protein|uniref:Tetratricopeptide repeat-containing protein n=1 Tax=Chryseolinea serpens TaxID=947013 RepID=A0A1M5VYX0_9BACT|nr:tetratricopeptide repeat protein [Chryseolinea serpens]SHH80194.1 Tetratricopeptide repeat-containing protein [Chryseolinea serpens]